MAYVKQNWENLPSTNTPITAERLNHMEDGIAEAWEHGGGSGAGETLRIGTILPYTGSDSEMPTGYMLCDGAELSRTDYSDLFAVIGTSFGAGNGSSTFNLPNLKGKVLTGLDEDDTDFASIGATGGSKYLQEHTHKFGFMTGINTVGNSSPYSEGRQMGYNPTNRYTDTSTAGTGNAGNLQPYVVVNYIIKVTQSAPVQAQIVGTKTETDIDGYSTNYLNGKLGIELYDDDTGSSGTITLSDDITNYSYLEIYGYEINGQSQVYTKYDVSSEKAINLFSTLVLQTGNLIRVTAQLYTASGNTLTPSATNTGHANIFNKTVNEQNATGDIRITKVIGIK